MKKFDPHEWKPSEKSDCKNWNRDYYLRLINLKGNKLVLAGAFDVQKLLKRYSTLTPHKCGNMYDWKKKEALEKKDLVGFRSVYQTIRETFWKKRYGNFSRRPTRSVRIEKNFPPKSICHGLDKSVLYLLCSTPHLFCQKKKIIAPLELALTLKGLALMGNDAIWATSLDYGGHTMKMAGLYPLSRFLLYQAGVDILC